MKLSGDSQGLELNNIVSKSRTFLPSGSGSVSMVKTEQVDQEQGAELPVASGSCYPSRSGHPSGLQRSVFCLIDILQRFW